MIQKGKRIMNLDQFHELTLEAYNAYSEETRDYLPTIAKFNEIYDAVAAEYNFTLTTEGREKLHDWNFLITTQPPEFYKRAREEEFQKYLAARKG